MSRGPLYGAAVKAVENSFRTPLPIRSTKLRDSCVAETGSCTTELLHGNTIHTFLMVEVLCLGRSIPVVVYTIREGAKLV